MGKSSTSNSNASAPGFQPPRYRPRWLAAVCCLLLGLWLAVAFFDYSPLQEGYLTSNSTVAGEKSLVGKIGADIARISFVWLGVGAWLVPLFSFWSLWLALRNARRLALTRFGAMLLALLAACGLAAMLKFVSLANSQYFPQGRLGGSIGHWIYDSLLADTVGVFGAASLLVTVYVVALIFIFTRDIGAEFDRFFANIHAWRERRAERRREKAEAKQRAKAAKAKALAEIAAAQAAAKAVALPKTLKIAKPKDDPLALPPVVNPAKTAPAAPATPDEPPPEATPRKGAAKVIGLKLSGRSDKSSAEEAAG